VRPLPFKEVTTLDISGDLLWCLAEEVESIAMFWLAIMKRLYPDWSEGIDQIYGKPCCSPTTYTRLFEIFCELSQRWHPAIPSERFFFGHFIQRTSCKPEVLSAESTAVFYPDEVERLKAEGRQPDELLLTDSDLYVKMRIPEINNG
jgi:hypothetical protein